MSLIIKAALDAELKTLSTQAAQLPDGGAAAQITKGMLHILMRSMVVCVQHLAKNTQGALDAQARRLSTLERYGAESLLEIVTGLEKRIEQCEAKR